MMKATEANAVATNYALARAVELSNEVDAIIRKKASHGKFYACYLNNEFENITIREIFKGILEVAGYEVTYLPALTSFDIHWGKKN